MAPHEAVLAERPASPLRSAMIVLQHISHPELAPIRIDGSLFAIGRTEAPFDSYVPEIVAELSRRHARIFCEGGTVYLADLDSKNGTTVNGVPVKRAITRLSNGAEIGLGRALRLRVEMAGDVPAPAPAARLVSLTLTPEGSEHGLQAIVIASFPFLISKVDDAFARYKDAYPHQVNFLSRRHAHIFLRGGRAFIEDLGSTNGTFLDHARLDEHAVALEEGAVVAFGGRHFVYRVSAQWAAPAPEPTVTQLAARATAAAVAAVVAPDAADKTTFVAAADSFLDIFCVDPASAQEDGQSEQSGADAAPDAAAGPLRPRGKIAAFLSDLTLALGARRGSARRAMRWGLPLLALAVILTWAVMRIGAPEREAQELLAHGDYARAAAVAGASLADDPDNPQLKALATQALLKAGFPGWAAALKARQYAQAAAIVAGMKASARNNRELQSLVGELEWIVKLEQYVAARGGPDAASRNAADAAWIKRILQQWEDDSAAHQRAFATISAQVPEYRDAYAEALSLMRKLALTGDRAEHAPAANP